MSTILYAYLGVPGSMRQLMVPRRGWDSAPSLGDSIHPLMSGGTAVVRNLYPKRAWPISTDVTATESDVILGFYQGVYGAGPFRLVDPTARNMLRLDVATCGVRAAAAHGWIQSTGALARASGGPTGVDSGVLTWTSLAASATLQPGTVANVADITTAPVYLPGEPVTVSLYVKASSSTTASLQLTGYDAAGAVLVTSAATSMSLTTAWQRFTVIIAANAAAFASAVYVLPRVVLGGTVPTSVSIAGAQVEYADAVTAFQIGFGSPRVTIAGGPGRIGSVPGWRSHSLTLAEV